MTALLDYLDLLLQVQTTDHTESSLLPMTDCMAQRPGNCKMEAFKFKAVVELDHVRRSRDISGWTSSRRRLSLRTIICSLK